MNDLISRQALCEYALNQKDKSVTPNDIMRFPSAQPDLQPTCNNLATDCISRQDAMDALERRKDKNAKGYIGLFYNNIIQADIESLMAMPSAQQDNHELACLLAELFGDTCACNFNGIDEWLPDKCEFLDACPDPGGVTCWEQFLKHRAERKNDG